MSRRLITNAGELILLTRMLKQTGTALALRLIAIPFTPSQDLTLADLTAPVFAGYADAILNDADWTVEASADGKANATGITQEFDYVLGEATESIYGAAIYQESDDTLVSIELFDAPATLTGSSTFEFTPRIQLYDTADALTNTNPPTLF